MLLRAEFRAARGNVREALPFTAPGGRVRDGGSGRVARFRSHWDWWRRAGRVAIAAVVVVASS